MSGFTHFNEDGNAVMVDVGEKAETKREALASGVIRMSEECFQKVKEGSMKKGDVLGVARIAGIMGAKKTAELIPLCHLLNLTKVEIDFEYLEEEHGIRAICHTACTGRTGVEMEALTGVNTALLTIYDMCKAVDRGMEIREIHLMPEEAYGMPDPSAVLTFEIEQLAGSENLEVGQQVYLYNEMGQPFPVKVVAKDDATITLDMNHEMAGKELNFKIELVEVQ